MRICEMNSIIGTYHWRLVLRIIWFPKGFQLDLVPPIQLCEATNLVLKFLGRQIRLTESGWIVMSSVHPHRVFPSHKWLDPSPQEERGNFCADTRLTTYYSYRLNPLVQSLGCIFLSG